MKPNPLSQALASAHTFDPAAANELTMRKMAIKAELERCITLVDEDRLAAIIVAERRAPGSAEITATPHGHPALVMQTAAYILRSLQPAQEPAPHEPHPS